jgi:hypothetical protein
VMPRYRGCVALPYSRKRRSGRSEGLALMRKSSPATSMLDLNTQVLYTVNEHEGEIATIMAGVQRKSRHLKAL